MINAFTPYLHFNGNCEEALNFYAEILDGKIEYMSHWSNGELSGKVMHAHLSFPENWAISAGDSAETNKHGNTVELHIQIDNAEQAFRIFKQLSENGKTMSEISPNPKPDEGSMSGAVIDKYGFVWIITAPSN